MVQSFYEGQCNGHLQVSSQIGLCPCTEHMCKNVLTQSKHLLPTVQYLEGNETLNFVGNITFVRSDTNNVLTSALIKCDMHSYTYM